MRTQHMAEAAGASNGPFPVAPSGSSIDLYWLPLGAGGHFVRLNGRIYEAIRAVHDRRRAFALYHSALEVRIPDGRFVIEMAWPIPDADGASRGVVVEGPVGSSRMARLRLFRYEVRRWRDGVIPDVLEAVASPQRLSDNLVCARRLLDLVGSVPAPVWGRDDLGMGDMWNSNSVVSWLLARSGLPMERIRPPIGGRAPGWDVGIATARCEQRGSEEQRRLGESHHSRLLVASCLPHAGSSARRDAVIGRSPSDPPYHFPAPPLPIPIHEGPPPPPK